jgi:hypothetical protein
MDDFVVFHIEGGIGKNIVATAVLKSIKANYPERKIIVITAHPEVFVNNSNVYRVYKFGMIPYFYEDYIKNKNTVILRSEPYFSGDLLYCRKTLTEIWCDIFNIPCIDTKPEIFLTERELIYANAFLRKDGPILIVQSYGGSSENQNHLYSWARDLPPLFAQDLINSVYKNFTKVLHFSRSDQPSLENTIKVTDNLRTLFCYIALSDKIIGIDSFVQHAAAALNKKATVGWIANSSKVFGHNMHHNIIANGAESFRHKIDSYLQEYDWVGNRFYECPYDNLNNIFDKNEFIKTLAI